MDPLPLHATSFTLGDQHFVMDLSPANRRLSNQEAWTLVKSPAYVNAHLALARIFKPRAILELGVFQGGGYVLFDQLFQPDAISAVEWSREPIELLMSYIGQRPGRHVHFNARQEDTALLNSIVADDLSGRLDMVVDDASHRYEQSRTSFGALFPLLAPGGYYIIEDWGWAHGAAYQSADAPLAHEPALTNLIFEILTLEASTSLIAEVRVTRPMVTIKRSLTSSSGVLDLWASALLRGKSLTLI